MTALSGSLPVQFAPNYHCEDGTCGCSKGYGNFMTILLLYIGACRAKRAKQVEAG